MVIKQIEFTTFETNGNTPIYRELWQNIRFNNLTIMAIAKKHNGRLATTQKAKFQLQDLLIQNCYATAKQTYQFCTIMPSSSSSNCHNDEGYGCGNNVGTRKNNGKDIQS